MEYPVVLEICISTGQASIEQNVQQIHSLLEQHLKVNKSVLQCLKWCESPIKCN